MLIGNNYPKQMDLAGRGASQSNNSSNGSSIFQSNLESIKDELDRRLEGVTCEDQRSDIVNDVLGAICLGHFDPNKVDDVLTPETRYQLTQEDKDYFANKYDIGNMGPTEMDEMLYEMEQMGAITQSERLAVNPFINTDGTLSGFTMVTIVPTSNTGEGSSVFLSGQNGESSLVDHWRWYYEGDPLNFWEERMKTLQQELVTGGDNVDKEAHREELAGTETVLGLLDGIFGKGATTSSDAGTNTASGWQPFGVGVEDPTVANMKRQLQSMIDHSYQRARLEILDEEEEEQENFDSLIDMVDKAIEATDQTLAEDLMEELVGDMEEEAGKL